MKILITGGTGLLGKALMESKNKGDEIFATYVGNYTMEDQPGIKYLKLDILDITRHNRLFKEFNPDVVIHTASIGSPDYAQQHKDLTWAVNVNGTENMVGLCDRFKVRFIYISSNGIYDGNHAPYGEEDSARPINYYGETKLVGEACAKKAKYGHAIVRPILLYGWNSPFERGNIVTTSIGKLRKRETVYAYNDVFCNPLFSNECARAVWAIIQKKLTGAFNIAGADRVSVFELLRRTAKIFGFDEALIHPVQQGYFNELVKRPADTSFQTQKMETILKIMPISLDEGLGRMKAQQR